MTDPVLIPRILAGNYGDGTRGIKTSYPGCDVKIRTDDQDTTKRSFNSEWSNLCKVKMIGAATQEYVPYQNQGHSGPVPSSNFWVSISYSQNGWILLPVEVITGLDYIPVWEERCYEPATKLFWDDRARAFLKDALLGVPGSPGETHVYGDFCFSGARSFFVAPGSLFLEPWVQNNITGFAIPDTNPINVNSVQAVGDNPPPFPPYPAYPAAPAKPTTPIPYCAYVIYANKIGDPS